MVRAVIRLLLVFLSSVAGLVLFFLSYFLLTDLYPKTIDSFSVNQIKYFALLKTKVWDDELAFRQRPNLRHEAVIGQKYLDHPVLSEGLEPILYRATFDSEGFRTASGKPPWDIVVLGDSFMECGESDTKTFSAIFHSLTGRSVRNLGTSWWGPEQYLRVYKRQLGNLKEQLVVFGFFEGNDIRDIAAYAEFERTGLYYDYGRGAGTRLSRLYRASADAMRFVDLSFHGWIRTPIAKLRGRYRDPNLRMAAHLRIGDRSFWDIFFYPGESRSKDELQGDPHWLRFEEILGELGRVVRERGARLVALFIPTKQHIYIPYATEKSGDIWQNLQATEMNRRGNTEKAFLAVCRRTGTLCLSLTKIYEEYAKEGERLYLPFDSHWSVRGREVAAQEVQKVFTLYK